MSTVTATEPRLYCIPTTPILDRIDVHPDGAPPGPWDLDSAYRFCERIAQNHYENFPVASRFVPADLRKHVVAIYAFARAADDFADEPHFAGRRRESLDQWELMLETCYHREVDHPVFLALRDTVRRHRIPIAPLKALLTAFRMDLSKHEYSSFSELMGYCQHSANPVGQLVLYIHGHQDPSLHRFSDSICSALQLANFWQDLSIDIQRGRVYLPAEDLVHFGVSRAQLHADSCDENLRELIAYCVERTRALFVRGRPLVRHVSSGLSMELEATYRGGMKILDRIEQADFDVLAQRPRLDKKDMANIAIRSVFSVGRRWIRGAAS